MARKMSINALREALAAAEANEVQTIGKEMQRITKLTTWEEIFASIVSKPDEIVNLFREEKGREQEKKNRRRKKRDEHGKNNDEDSYAIEKNVCKK
ncbi:MAG: hypothetical protein E7200_02020 [Selenomonas ruminantium]|nr:hypothetical protein [Selenomonas ruminantium]